ncbi:hypothetical protein QCJ92_00001755 [Enterobacter roggenkampii]|uniref:hypothetical protein n=1 Tax=Enterobacter roggenkampii TaxID=1812935 RepID=UPI003042D8F2|nr:hypothetical protein [Enterobacter roggenkampii]
MKVGKLEVNQEKVLKWVKSIPFLGAVFLVANFYANSGVLSKRKQVATLSNWFKRIFLSFIFTLVFSIGLVVFFRDGLFHPNHNPTGLDAPSVALSIFPSILGFGIGVFVVIFALPNQFMEKVNSMKAKGGSKTFGASLMVVDMAYPLMVYAVVLLGEFLIKLFQISFLTQIISVFLLLYGMLMTFDLISLIFMTAYTLLAIQASKTP